MSLEFLWYLPNTVEPGHRGDTASTEDGYGSLDYQVDLAKRVEDHGWTGALLGTGWGRPDTFTVATALAARTTTFEPLIAIRPGYWRPAHFAVRGRHAGPPVAGPRPGQHRLRPGRSRGLRRRRGRPGPALRPHQGVHAARPPAVDRGERHLRRRALPRRRGRRSRPARRPGRPHPPAPLLRRRLGGRRDRSRPPRPTSSSSGASRSTASPSGSSRLRGARAEPRAGAAAAASSACASRPWSATPPSRPGTTPRRRSPRWPRTAGQRRVHRTGCKAAVGQQRLLDLAARGDVLDDNLYTAPGKYGGGGAGTTWLVGSAEDVADVAAASTRTSASRTSCCPTPPTRARSPGSATSCHCCGGSPSSSRATLD